MELDPAVLRIVGPIIGVFLIFIAIAIIFANYTISRRSTHDD